MDIIQIRTIGAWKGAQERSGKPCSCYLVHSHAFYKEWADISRKCVAIVNHKRVVYWVNNYTKNETHGWKTWCLHGATVWPHHTLVKIGECFPYVVMRAFHKTKGQNFLCPLSTSFIYDEHTTCKSPCANLAIFWVHLPYLGDYVHFLGINAHSSSWNSRC